MAALSEEDDIAVLMRKALGRTAQLLGGIRLYDVELTTWGVGGLVWGRSLSTTLWSRDVEQMD